MVKIPETGFNEISEFALFQNYPNPFNPKTNIKFDVIINTFIKLEIFDMLGRNVLTLINERLQPGTYELSYDMSDLNSGIYLYKLSAESFSKTMKMLLIK
ncbi:MAG: T9SS type A sorting domain-containing protein [Ignavibacteria bacterium]|nr:T9SS type A sorting domain-containing protein [Ignavibacteria bacterium]